jgi:hypothetical protein
MEKGNFLLHSYSSPLSSFFFYMFDFERFPVYIQAEKVYALITDKIFSQKINLNIKDQLKRASSSIILNIAEGAGKYSKADKKNYYITAR